MIDFDREIDRSGTFSVKHDLRQAMFGTSDVIPLWVADMDLPAPEAVTRALISRAQHPVYGYTLPSEGLFEALIDWMGVRHHWKILRDWILLCPGVVPSLHAAVLAFTQPGEGVIVQPPVYFPFFSAVTTTGRRLVQNPLVLDSGRYRMDLDHLEHCARQGARLLLLCSPHNPVGRVWQEGELHAVCEIASRHGLIILSDEIHHDLIYSGIRHHPLNGLRDDAGYIVTAVAPSKTFNIPGLGLSALIVPDPARRKALTEALDLLHVNAANPFGLAAFEAAYREGKPWLEELLLYLEGNRDFVMDFLRREIPPIHGITSEGTYLLWLDCRGLHLDDEGLKRFFVREARLGLNPGTVFGEGGSGFMRLNLGTSRRVLSVALEQLRVAVEARG